ncbi:uncharacterized protein NPIL_148491 [Nephila pilipes]|uniref:Uncharacterized protein n=1 Tax=Nephila pilipes TaxID=299642 RepID=A0A8X6NR36_NEPPI|nr:uncharacterized protein NPIL_148491 [Nephila pilipes]
MNFLHSLEHLALVKVATEIFGNPEIREYERELRSPFYFARNELWEPFIIGKVPTSLFSITTQEKLIGLFKPLSYELLMWRKDHSPILGPNADQQINFCWKSEGTIDRLQTAKRVVHYEHFTITQRFTMACYYWMTDEVVQLWEKLLPSEYENLMTYLGRMSLSVYGIDGILISWIKWLTQGAEREELYNYIFGLVEHLHHRVPPPDHLWRKLPTITVEQELRFRVIHHSRSFLGRYYLSKMDTTQQMEFMKERPFSTLRLFLDWPLQYKFMEMIKYLSMHWDETGYYDIFSLIVREKIDREFTDFNYKALLKEIWLQCSSDVKEYARNRLDFERIRKYVSE